MKETFAVCLHSCYGHYVPKNETERISEAAVELRILSGKLRRRLRDQATPTDFTSSEVAVVSYIDRHGPTTVTEIAAAEGMRPQSMGATVAALEADGVISRAPDPTDGRRVILSITPAARELVDSNRAAKEGWLFRAISTTFDATELKQLEVGIELLNRLVNS
jgi:DNA-binding MarR family transcriptional regulator